MRSTPIILLVAVVIVGLTHDIISQARASPPLLVTDGVRSAPAGVLGDLQNDPSGIDCGSTGDPEEIAPGGTSASAASSMCIQNASATCVYVGGSAVVGAGGTVDGIAVGDGCAAGKLFCANTRRMWCEAASGTVTVQVAWGVQ